MTDRPQRRTPRPFTTKRTGASTRTDTGARTSGAGAFDLSALNRDEALLSALGRGDRPVGADSDEVTDLLYQWRADLVLHSDEVAADVPAYLDDGPSELTRAARIFGRAGRRVVVAAAIAVIGVGSIGGVAAATDAAPGSPFWPIARWVNTERARSVQAAEDARGSLANAADSIVDDRTEDATRWLNRADSAIQMVMPEDGAAELRQRSNQLRARLSLPLQPIPTPMTTPPPPGSVPPGATSSTPKPSPTDIPTTPTRPTTPTTPPTTTPTSPTPSPTESGTGSPNTGKPNPSASGTSTPTQRQSTSGGQSSSGPLGPLLPFLD